LQKKVKEYEQKKEVLKRKSECFTQLLDMAKKDGLPEAKKCRSEDSSSPVQLVFANAGSASVSDFTNPGSASNSEFEEGYEDSESSTHVRIVRNGSNSGICIEFENESEDLDYHENEVGEIETHSQSPMMPEEETTEKSDSKATKVSERNVRKTARPRRSIQNKEFVSSEDIPN
jgi:hypothetical protein